MLTEIKTPSFDPSWELPRTRYYLAFPKKTPYCLVIPVLNEGQRIKNQLSHLKDLGIPSQVDLILSDGGSQDGSLDLGNLSDLQVRCLLVKEDSGKLGAQLRSAYAFALSEGYEGVITMDGNNKDNPEAIALFIKELRKGVDYVQGSRYWPGGKSIRTPFHRALATRLIHDPVISWAAKKTIYDTPNGFRAYSRRYLENPSVKPFRRVFQSYELLQYLAIRAAQLGLSLSQVPVTRTYPAQGPIPTKISPFKGYLSLLGSLWKAARGDYAP